MCVCVIDVWTAGLMDDALNLQRIEDGRFEVRMAPFELGRMIEYVTHAHSIRIRTSSLRIAIQMSERARGAVVVSDEVRLRQCLSNLVDNAIKFSPAGGLIEVSCDIEDEARITIGVRDEGPGVSDSDR